MELRKYPTDARILFEIIFKAQRPLSLPSLVRLFRNKGQRREMSELEVLTHLGYLEHDGYIVRVHDGMPSRDRWQVSVLQMLALIDETAS